MAAKTLLDVRNRVRETANINSQRISDTRLTEIVNDAVSEISSSGRLRFTERSIAVTLATGNDTYQPLDPDGVIEKPVLWVYTNPLTNAIAEIKQTTLEGWRTSLSDPDAVGSGLPTVYTIWGELNESPVFRIFPVPTQDIDTTLDVRIKFYELVNDTDTNSLITGGYDAVSYLSLVLASPYLENDDRIDTWNQSYTRAFGRLMRSHAAARYSGSARRSMREPG